MFFGCDVTKTVLVGPALAVRKTPLLFAVHAGPALEVFITLCRNNVDINPTAKLAAVWKGRDNLDRAMITAAVAVPSRDLPVVQIVECREECTVVFLHVFVAEPIEHLIESIRDPEYRLNRIVKCRILSPRETGIN